MSDGADPNFNGRIALEQPFVLVAFYSIGTKYEQLKDRLVESIEDVGIKDHVIMGYPNTGSWYINMQRKPSFLYEMTVAFPGRNLVYVDVDAVFKHYPKLFDTLECPTMALHGLDTSVYNPHRTRIELLTGTIFLHNNEATKAILKAWDQRCKSNPRLWDQKALEQVIGPNYVQLPPEYCCIFDTMSFVKDPIIVHHQASREFRKTGGAVPTLETIS